jgi:hypothetical protein
VFTTEDGRVTIHASVRDSIHPPCSSILGTPHMRPRHRAALDRAPQVIARAPTSPLALARTSGRYGGTAAGRPTHCGGHSLRTFSRSTHSHTHSYGRNACALQRRGTPSALAQVNMAVDATGREAAQCHCTAQSVACRCMTTRRSMSRCAVLAKLCTRHRFKAQWQVRLQHFRSLLRLSSAVTRRRGRGASARSRSACARSNHVMHSHNSARVAY